MVEGKNVRRGNVGIGFVVMKSANKKIYFASDAHLGLTVHGDPLAREKRLVKWMDSIKSTAKAVYFVGDMFDYWFEYKYVVPKGYVRFIGKMAEFVDAGIPIYLFAGNHDIWMFDYFQKEVGATVYTDSLTIELDGKKFYIAHGDGLGDPSLGFRFLRCFFRNRFCQQLYKMIHPGITMPFGLGWSRYSRKSKLGDKAEQFLGEDHEYLIQFAKEYVKKENVNYFIFGHRHIMLDHDIRSSSKLFIIGDWLTNFSYGVWDGENFHMERYLD